MDCRCDTCRSACEHRPGFFAHGEVEKAAAGLGLTLQEFFNKYLVADYWVRIGGDVYLLSPAIKGNPAGVEAAANPLGTCTFYNDGLCQIHENKPAECRHFDHDRTEAESQQERLRIVGTWEDNQEQIKELLGREPVAPEADFGSFSFLSMLLGS